MRREIPVISLAPPLSLPPPQTTRIPDTSSPPTPPPPTTTTAAARRVRRRPRQQQSRTNEIQSTGPAAVSLLGCPRDNYLSVLKPPRLPPPRRPSIAAAALLTGQNHFSTYREHDNIIYNVINISNISLVHTSVAICRSNFFSSATCVANPKCYKYFTVYYVYCS